MILSVRHTGTHTLKEYCKLTASYHFGLADPDIAVYEGLAHISIRDPLDVSMTWDARYPQGDYWLGELDDYDKLIAYVSGRKDTIFYKVEDIPMRKGQGKRHTQSKQKFSESPRANALRKWIRDEKRLRFFKQFYEGFWWLTE